MFTKTEAARKEALRQGLHAMRSYSLESGDDLRSPKRRQEVSRGLEVKKPKMAVIACPCCPWSILTYFQRDQEKVRARQLRDRVLLRLAAAAAKAQE